MVCQGSAATGKRRIGFRGDAFENLANALSTATCLALSIEPGTDYARPGQKSGLRQPAVACARCRTKPSQACRLHGVRNLAPCTAAPCILHIRWGADRTSEALRRFAKYLPLLDPLHSAGVCGLGACGVFGGGAFASIARDRPPQSTHGTCEADH